MKIDIDLVSGIIDECAQTHVMPRFQALAAHDIKTKSAPDDLVTQADLDMERALESALLSAYPGTQVLGEEAMAAGTVTLDLLANPDARIWVIDPIDGTYNFVHGDKKFGTLLAYLEGGKTQAGWIYDPPRRAVTVAQKGRGVFRNGVQFTLSKTEKASQASGAVNPRYFPKNISESLLARLGGIREHVVLRCAAHEYLDFIDGKIDFSLHSRANPWDHLAGALMIEELGGVVRTWKGMPYNPAFPENLLIAANPTLWDDVQKTVLKGLEPAQ